MGQTKAQTQGENEGGRGTGRAQCVASHVKLIARDILTVTTIHHGIYPIATHTYPPTSTILRLSRRVKHPRRFEPKEAAHDPLLFQNVEPWNSPEDRHSQTQKHSQRGFLNF